MNVFSLSAKISLDKSSYEKDLGSAKKSFLDFGDSLKGAAEKIGSVLSTMAKGATIAIGAASTAMTALVKQSLSEFANYEQLVGGVDKIFGESSKKVQEYANEAYKTAGLSANEYMETVTGFSASLIQGLKGDTEKAAEIANMAVKDMADNANTYGTDIAQIQSNYQALAKQNYTLLDNLKLGYGGTKAEMARLLNDANKIDSTILGKGVTVDEKFEDVSFDQMIRAIHTIQQELKITGTTADEAGRTISGSFGSMKAAWKNFLTGTGSPEQFVEALTGSIGNITRQLNQIIPRLVEGLKSLVVALAPELPKILMDILPTIIEGAASLLTSLTEQLPQLIDTLLPPLIQGATMVVVALVKNLPQILQSLIQAIPTVFTTLMENSGGLIEAGKEIIVMLVGGIKAGVTYLINHAGEIIDMVIDGFINYYGLVTKILEFAGEMLSKLADGLLSEENLNKIIKRAPEIVGAIVNAIVAGVNAVANLAFTIIDKLVDYFFGEDADVHWANMLDVALKIVTLIIEGIEKIAVNIWDGFKKIGRKIFEFLGLEEAYDWGVQMIEDIAKGAKEAVLDMFDFFAYIGEMISDAIFGSVGEDFANQVLNEKLDNDLQKIKAKNSTIEMKRELARTNPEILMAEAEATGDPLAIAEMQQWIDRSLERDREMAAAKNMSTGWHGGSYQDAANASVYVRNNGVQGVPVFGNGGIVTKPTLALIGEDGAEAVVPLEKDSEVGRKFGGGVSIEKIEVNVDAHGIEDINNIGNIIVQQIDAALRRFQVQQTRGQGGVAW